mgnify:CR=1 FL=1
MLQAYIYEPTRDDTLFCQTVVNLFHRKEKKQTSDNAFDTIVRLRGYTRETREGKKLYFRLDFDSNDKDQIIHDYNLAKERLITIRLTSDVRKAYTSIKLIPFAELIHIEQVHNFVSQYSDDRNCQAIIAQLLNDQVEFETVSGQGISLQTLEGWIEVVKQESHNLRRKTEQYKLSLNELSGIKATAEQYLEQKFDKDTLAQSLATLADKTKSKQAELKDLNNTIEELKAQAGQFQIGVTPPEQDHRNNTVKEEAEKEAAKSNTETQSEESTGTDIDTEPLRDTKDKMSTSFKGTLDPPIWRENTALPPSVEIDNFRRNLENFKALDVYKNDRELIYQALNKSNKLNVYAELADSENSDLSKFKTFLRDTYGGNDLQMRQELSEIKQTANESYLSFFRRVLSVYYRSRGKFTIPEISTINNASNPPPPERLDYYGVL